MAKKLSGMFPKHRVYVEPFAGGAAVFFHKPLAKVSVIADHDKWLTDFYKSVRRGKLRECSGGIKQSKDLFRRTKKNRQACYKLANTILSFHGNRQGYAPSQAKHGKVVLAGKLRRVSDYENKLKHAWIGTGDFAKVMKRFDAIDAVHFLDPPWPMKYSEYYKGGKGYKGPKDPSKKYIGTAFDPEHVKKVSKGMKGHVVIIINDTPKLRRLYCKDRSFKCKTVMAHTNVGFGNRNKFIKNLVITKPARRR